MAVEELVDDGVRNAFARRPVVDRALIERTWRRANRSLARGLGRIEWAGSLEAYIRGSAELLLDGWTLDFDGPLSPAGGADGSDVGGPRLELLRRIEDGLWSSERAAHTSSRLSPKKRLPVHLNALDQPQLAAAASRHALAAAAKAARQPNPRRPGFAADKWWLGRDEHWGQTCAIRALPFLTEVARCFGAGLFAAALWRRGASARTILIQRPRLRVRAGRLHAADQPAVVWPDGSERWYWNGIAVPEPIAAARDQLTADLVARIDNQEVRRVALERIGWPRFLDTAQAELRAHDDFGKLWDTGIRLDGERTHLVEVVNATAEPDGSYRRYFLRVPPTVRTAREAVAWTFGFNDPEEYAIAVAS
jgi:hypothetical protein